MKRSIIMLAVIALFAILAGVATVAHADQAPNPPSCGNNGPNGVISVSQPRPGLGTGKWYWDVTHNCNGKTYMSEIQVCDPYVPSGCVYQDVQGIHVFDVGNCDKSSCTRTTELLVACSNPSGTKQWRVQAWDNNSHVTSSVYRGACPS